MFNFMRLPPLRRLMLMKAITGGGSWSTVTGNPVSFTAIAAPLKQLQIAFSPVQDLHGYDSPWPAGGGKNLLYQMPTTSQTINGVAWSINADGSITANGTATGDSTFLYIPDTSGIGYSFDGDYKYKNFGYVSTSIMKIGVKIGDVWKTVYPNSYSAVSDVHGQIKQMWFQIRDGQTANSIAIYPLICKASETEPTAWTPYSNICPISGWDGVDIYLQSAYDPTAQPTISISFGQTVYSGTLDVLTGVVKARPYFASYNGETLVGPWMSSMDKYVAGTTPTVGAQVVDMGGTETTIQLTPQEVNSLAGDNVLFSDANGDLTVEYRSN